MSDIDPITGAQETIEARIKAAETYLSPSERDQVQRYLKFPEEFPKEFGAWLEDYIGTNAVLQKSQVQGLPLLNSQVQETLDSLEVIGTTYLDTAASNSNVSNGVAADPVVTVPAGSYFCIFTAQGQINDGGGSVTAQLYSVPASAVFGSTAVVSSDSVPSSIIGMICMGTVVMTDSSNQIKINYAKSGSGGRAVNNPVLVALRTAA